MLDSVRDPSKFRSDRVTRIGSDLPTHDTRLQITAIPFNPTPSQTPIIPNTSRPMANAKQKVLNDFCQAADANQKSPSASHP